MSDPQPTGDWPSEAAPVDRPAFPGYQILEELGRGGMGVVYKARQVAMNRLVGLKMIRDSVLAGPRERGRFRIEAEAAARMRHPNIVEIYEVGEHAGQPYFAMELIDGISLAKHLSGQPQPIRYAATLVRTLALAIQHAHERRIVHRDLKPANILLAGVTPKITDFGLAKRLDSESTAWTQDGAVLGTASYMPPEQAAGRAEQIGPLVDVYALGVILYEMLIGRPPFHAATWNETVQQMIHNEPAPPTRLRPDVPPELDAICLQCLEKQPGRRYASAAALADDLSRFLEGKPVTAVPPGEGERLARLASREGYQIVAEIGRGARTTVYHALYEPLKQPVALKVFQRGTYTREQWENRLRQGAELWAAIAHPQVIPVHRTGWWDDAPYLATEFVPHGSLAARISGEPLPIPEALSLVIRLTEIVTYIHRQGVVHGNLKPSNVLLAADGIPRVVDFRLTSGMGVSSNLGDEAPAGIAYLPPELARDRDAEARITADIYGLGAILYELLTGRPPFDATAGQDVLEQICSQDPVAPSQLNSAVTPYLEATCVRCLSKSPWQRYLRAYDLSKRLQCSLNELQGGKQRTR
jgi:serine/threonine protein kinase